MVCSPKIWNYGKKTIRISRYYVWFDWFKTNEDKNKFSVPVSVEVLPGKSKLIRDKLSIPIPKWIEPSHHSYNYKFDFEVKPNGDWETRNLPYKLPHEKILINKCSLKNYKVFISHRICKNDETFIDKLKEIFENNGYSPFIIEKDPQTSPSLWREINEKILQSDCFLLVWTDSAIDKPGELREELGKATVLEYINKKTAIPIFCLSESKNVPSSINYVKYTPIRRGSQMNNCIEEVLDSIEIQYTTKKGNRRLL